MTGAARSPMPPFDGTPVRDAALPPRWVVPYLALLMVCCALPFFGATLILDITRDLVAAAGIAEGAAYPLRGPVFNAMMHLGPAWYYLLALPILLTDSIAATLLFVGILSALKFPLAYACGRRLIDWRFGVAWAAMLAIPGWSLASAVIVTHTAVLESALLLVAWLGVLLVQTGRRLLWLALGFAAALAVHAHPSALVFAPLLLLVAWQRRAEWRKEMPWMAGALVAAALPLLPVLVAEAREGWPALEPLRSYAMTRLDRGSERVLPFLRGVFVDGARLPGEYLADGALASVLRMMLAAFGLLAVAGVLRAPTVREIRGTFALAVGAVVLAATGLFLLRPVTPFYMALVVVPPLAAVLASGLVAWRSPFLLRCGLGFAAAFGIASCYLLLRAGASGLATLPVERIGNVRSSDARGIPVALLPAWQLDALARDVCSHDRDVIVHSEVASLLDASLFLSAHLRCRGTGRIGIGGGADRASADHRLGLTPALARRLGLPGGDGWRSAWSMRPKQVIAAAGTEALPKGDIYPLRERSGSAASLHRWRFTAEHGDTVLVSQLFYAYDAARTVAVRADGKLQRPLIRTNAMTAYRCTDCGDVVEWQVEAVTPHPERADIVVAAP